MARVVITGGAGLLGSHLADELLGRGDEVVAIDNLSTGNNANIEHLLALPGFTFVEHDVSNYVWVPGEVNAVLHFASPASPIDYLKMPIQTLKVGSLGTHNTLGLAKAKGATYFLASTSEVYGDPQVHPQPEGYWGNVNPVGPRGVYDEAKRFSEAMTMAYHRSHGLDTRIVRIFNTYGPRMRLEDGRVVSTFIVQALKGEPLTIFGDGSQTRSFCFVEDEIRGLIALLDSGENHPVNLGADRELLIKELVEVVTELTGFDGRVVWDSSKPDGQPRRSVDANRARELFGFEARTDFRDGLRSTIDWYLAHRDEAEARRN